MNNICVIDDICNLPEQNNYSGLSIWGDPTIFYPINAAIESKLFEKIYLKTDSCYIRYIVAEKFGKLIETKYDDYFEKQHDSVCYLSSRAVMITAAELKRVYAEWKENSIAISVKRSPEFLYHKGEKKYFERINNVVINLFIIKPNEAKEEIQKILVSDKNSLVINCDNDFELALVLIKKRENAKILKEKIIERIAEKRENFKKNDRSRKTCCLIGHSQLDNWNIRELCGAEVRNCGIGGISSFQYNELILSQKFLECNDDFYIVMHGTNDIVYDYTFEEIFESIMDTVNYIKHRSSKPIIFLKCIHTNGRMDRANQKIDDFNAYISDKLPKDIFLMNVTEMDDEFGNLKQQYTSDGLHLNEYGYAKLEVFLERFIKNQKLCD